jgi:hypothetical protein
MDFGNIKEVFLFLLIFPLAALILIVILSLGYVGWKLSGKINNPYLRIIVRAAAIAIPFTPAPTPSPVPAVWILFLDSSFDRIIFGLIPILVVFTLGVIIGYGANWEMSKRVK